MCEQGVSSSWPHVAHFIGSARPELAAKGLAVDSTTTLSYTMVLAAVEAAACGVCVGARVYFGWIFGWPSNSPRRNRSVVMLAAVLVVEILRFECRRTHLMEILNALVNWVHNGQLRLDCNRFGLL
jgi:hypothetical protein